MNERPGISQDQFTDENGGLPIDNGVDARFRVDWVHRVRFTRDVFDPENTTLRDVIQAEPDATRRFVVVMDRGVAECWPDLADRLGAYAAIHEDRMQLAAAPIELEGGESVKNNHVGVDRVVRLIHEEGICRHSYVMVIGGGAVLDAAGYAASIAHRGVRLIRLPTTTLAQDDSGVGVKNGINAFGKKNFIGSFSPPWAVINDCDFLTTLSSRDWRCGFSEAVKVGLVKDHDFFHTIRAQASGLVARDLQTAQSIVRRSAQLHLDHILTGGDPFERSEARPLDFGHWSAHKLEQMTDYDLRHGEAVAIGMALDATYSRLMGWLGPEDCQAILDCLVELGFAIHHELLSDTEHLFEGIHEFNEHLGGRLTMAMLSGIGSAIDVHEIDRDLMRLAIDELAGHHASDTTRIR